MKLGIIISALGSNLFKIKKWLSNDIMKIVHEIIIVVQRSGEFQYEIESLKEMGCTLVIDDGLGVSRSRNIGIKKCTSDFFWILDDDIYSNLEMVKSIISSIKSKNFDIYTFRIAHDYNGTLYKKYLTKQNVNKLQILKISSIEMVISKKIIDNYSILFNENFGLGSKYPSCEENLFLLECFNHKVKIGHIPKIIVIHEQKGSGYLKISQIH